MLGQPGREQLEASERRTTRIEQLPIGSTEEMFQLRVHRHERLQTHVRDGRRPWLDGWGVVSVGRLHSERDRLPAGIVVLEHVVVIERIEPEEDPLPPEPRDHLLGRMLAERFLLLMVSTRPLEVGQLLLDLLVFTRRQPAAKWRWRVLLSAFRLVRREGVPRPRGKPHPLPAPQRPVHVQRSVRPVPDIADAPADRRLARVPAGPRQRIGVVMPCSHACSRGASYRGAWHGFRLPRGR